MCPACDRPRPAGQTQLCDACVRGMIPRLTHRGVITAVSYEGTAAELIRRLKFEGRRDAIPVLVELLAHRVAELSFQGIVPIPRHWRRVRDQGCDPVHDLGRALARATGRPLWERRLCRSRPTLPQIELSPAQRRRNPAGSFHARPGPRTERAVLLLDDVTTTGATLRVAARALRQGGAASRVLRVAVAGTPTLSSPGPRAL